MLKNNEVLPATQADVDKGTAVFCIPDSRSKVYDLGSPLPVEAAVTTDMEVGGEGERIPAGTIVTVVQAEIVDESDVLLGFVYGEERGVCMLDQVQFSNKGDASNRA